MLSLVYRAGDIRINHCQLAGLMHHDFFTGVVSEVEVYQQSAKEETFLPSREWVSFQQS